MVTQKEELNAGAEYPTIYFLKGISGSGKSTWAKANCENLNAIRVNKDSLRDMMGLPYSKDSEGAVVHASREMGKEALRRGISVIVDDTNLSPKHKNAWKNIASDKSITANFKEVFFDIPLKDCIRRDAERENSVGETVILQQWNLLTGGVCNNVIEYVKQDKLLPSAIIVDIDGTVAFAKDRNIYDSAKCSTDIPNIPVVNLIQSLQRSGFYHRLEDGGTAYEPDPIHLIFLTGREGTNECIKNTMDWIAANITNKFSLITRAKGDSRKDSVTKRELYEKYIKDEYNVLFVLDDRDSVVDMWRKDLKLPCFQVYYGNF